MAENEISILIKVYDEATEKLMGINTQLDKLSSIGSKINAPMESMNKVITTFSKNAKISGTTIETFSNKFLDLTVASKEPVNQLNKLGLMVKAVGLTSRQMKAEIGALGIGLTETGQFFDQMTGKIVPMDKALRLAQLRVKRFKFEYLGLLFALMAINRALGGIIKAQMELFGISDVLSAMWTVVMAPAMEMILPPLMAFATFMMDLPEPIKKAIGVLMLLIFALTTLGVLFITLKLSMQGWVAAFGGLKILGKIFTGIGAVATKAFAAIGVAIQAIAPFILPIIAIIAGLALIVAGVYMVFKEKFEGIGLIIMGIGVILLLFIGWWALIPIAVGAAVFLIIKYWDNIKKFFANVWEAIKSIFKIAWTFIVNFLTNATLIGIIIKNWETIRQAFILIWNSIKTFFVNLWNGLVSFLRTIWDGIRNGFAAVWNGLKSGVQAFINFFKGCWDGIKSVFKGVINFFISGINFWIGAFEKMINFAIRGLNTIIKLINKIPGIELRTIGEIKLPKIPQFEKGGMVDETGLAFLHAGEKVIPKNQVATSSTFSPSIVVNLNGTGPVNGDELARRISESLNREWSYKFQRSLRR